MQQNAQRSGYGDLVELQDSLIDLGNAAASEYPNLDKISRAFVVAVPGPTLAESVALIDQGKYDNNFYAGDPEQLGRPRSTRAEVGLCLLDKAYALLHEDPITNYPIDFQIDFSACCTKKAAYPTCIDDLEPSYALLVNASKGSDDQPLLLQAIFSQIVHRAMPLLEEAELGDAGQLLVRLCTLCSDPWACADLDMRCPNTTLKLFQPNGTMNGMRQVAVSLSVQVSSSLVHLAAAVLVAIRM